MDNVMAQRMVFGGLAVGDIVYKSEYIRFDADSCYTCKGYGVLYDVFGNSLMCHKCHGSGKYHDYKYIPTEHIITGFNYFTEDKIPEIEIYIDEIIYTVKATELFSTIKDCEMDCDKRNANLKR